MTLTSKAVLTVDATLPSGQTTGVFEFAGDLEIVPERVPSYLLDGRAALVNNFFQGQIGAEDSGGAVFAGDASIQTVSIEFRGWQGSVDANGDPLQWGDDPNSGGTKTSGTGDGPLEQMAVLNYYLNNANVSSTNPATLEYGAWSSSGRYSPLSVAIEGPQLSQSATDGVAFNGSIRFLKVSDLRNALDSAVRPD